MTFHCSSLEDLLASLDLKLFAQLLHFGNLDRPGFKPGAVQINIPTLSGWAMIMFAGLLVLFGFIMERKRLVV